MTSSDAAKQVVVVAPLTVEAVPTHPVAAALQQAALTARCAG